jgi:hypothetical protein
MFSKLSCFTPARLRAARLLALALTLPAALLLCAGPAGAQPQHDGSRRTADTPPFLRNLPEPERPMLAARSFFLNMLAAGSIDFLEKRAAGVRETGETLIDGQPVLAAIYTGIGDDCNCQQRNEMMVKMVDEKLKAWRERFPESVTAEIITGELIMNRAWAARGGGYAGTVTQEGWAAFNEGMARAEQYFLNASARAKADPEWYAAMLDIALARRWPPKRQHALFVEGAKKHPRYFRLYLSAAEFYSPRWGAPAQGLEEFVKHAASLHPGALGDEIFTRLSVGYERDLGKLNGTDMPFLERVLKGYAVIVADSPARWNYNNYARYACHASKRELLRELEIGQIQNKPIMAAWLDSADHYLMCRNAALAEPAKK